MLKNNFLHEKLIAEEQSFISDLEKFKAGHKHPTIIGDSTEMAWIHLLRKYLPNRYNVDSGMVVDCKGKTSDQIDLIIYDSYFTPKISYEGSNVFAPIESVYAVFEIKQLVNSQFLKYAEDKYTSVDSLTRTNVPFQTASGMMSKSSEDFKIIWGLLARNTCWVEGLNSDAFTKNISNYPSINFVITAESGFYDSSASKKIYTSQASLSKSLFRLFIKLREMGNPPGIDYDEYSKTLG